MKYHEDEQIEYSSNKVTTDLDDVVLSLKEAELTDVCSMRFSAGTNGFKGGDSGHGSRSYIAIRDTGGSDIHIHDWTPHVVGCNGYIKISVGGDAELRLLIDGLRWMADTLEEQAHIEKIKTVQKSIGIV